MDYQITDQDLAFVKWLDSKGCDHYWEKDEKGAKVILRSGWGRAHEEYNRIKAIEIEFF